jgi:uncharacterized protein (DUF305 family)
MRSLPAAALAAFVAILAPANAQQGMDHSKMGHGAPPPASANASTKAFIEANERMHKDMAISFSGDADIDFIRGMIPHHQGAIDMARVVLAHGKDAETRKLAQEIIAAQEKEIAMMQAWLKKRGR